MGRSLSEQPDSIHTKIWNYFFNFFGYVFVFLIAILSLKNVW